MIFSIRINDKTYEFDAGAPLDIAIPLDFGGAQPNAFGVERASSKAYETGALVGDTRRGGSCNFEQIKFVPHCNGTHTESVGHLTDARISVHECLQDSFVPATLVSVAPENFSDTGETYAVRLDENDFLITEKSLRAALENADQDFLAALIVRTLPNDDDKKRRTYLENSPPFFSFEAMNYIAEKRVNHLLADTPSIDRPFDEGKLANHRIFWNVAPGSRRLDETSLTKNTITEMIYVADEIEDGAYFLNLQIAAFAADAAPSRPRLFKIRG